MVDVATIVSDNKKILYNTTEDGLIITDGEDRVEIESDNIELWIQCLRTANKQLKDKEKQDNE